MPLSHATRSSTLVVALALALAADGVAAQVCAASVFMRSAETADSVTLRMTRSVAVHSQVDGWSLLACFVLALRGTSPQTADAVIDFHWAQQPRVPLFTLSGATKARQSAVP
jgi:hypothetical protein